ncbi:CD109 antigen-like [Physella acuta]|uniref:CD109 antigen-like n=1 Tax=Physella acuta TaxID=109671 RepID=UPI0027DC86DE|nr:CD109 antigen-like [Physella acuta]
MRLFLLLTLVATTMCAQNTYVVIAPSTIYANMNFTVSVNILKATGDVTVVAQVLRGITPVASGVNVYKTGTPGTITMQLPPRLPNSDYTFKVVGSGGLVFDNSTRLSYNSKEASLFIQLNKAIFKPSDTVKFRVFGVYSDLQSYKRTMDISIYDAQKIKIKQWVKVSPEKGVIAQELTLSSQPVLGEWKISVEAGKMKEEKSFTVAEFVLPKFKVEVIMPPYVLTSDADITFIVKAKYAYGKPVKGSANVQVNLHDYWETKPVYKATVPIEGETRVMVPVSKVKDIRVQLHKRTLTTVANVTESLTGIKVSSSGTVTIYQEGVNLKLLADNHNFKPGLHYTMDIKISQPDGRPIGSSSENVKVTIKGSDSKFDCVLSLHTGILTQTQSVPTNGRVTLRPLIPPNTEFIYITTSFRGVSKTACVGKSHSPSSSHLHIYLHSSSIKAGDTIMFSAEGTEELPTLTYQVLSRGTIVKSGTINGNNQKSIHFSIVSEPSMAPSARIVVYYVRPDGEVVPDSISFDISGAFNNKVTVDVDKTDGQPGDEVTIVTTSDPDSNVYLLAIDQSDVLLKNENDVTFADVHTEIMNYDTDFTIRFCRTSSAGVDLENAGVTVLTDAMVYRDRSNFDIGDDPLEYGAKYRATRAELYAARNADPLFRKSARVRKISPDSWLWTDVYVGANGSASITATVPDTITSWVVSAFAINSNSGLGVAPTQAHLKVFRPFFVSLNLPYSVTRGEQLALQANVFNYLTDDMQVRVTLAASKCFHYIFIHETGNQELKQFDAVQDVVVKAGEAMTVYFPIVPADLGRIDVEVKAQSTKAADTVRRQLLVEAEGVPKQYNIPVLIDLTERKTTFSKTIDLTLPANVVKGSELVRISAVGDLMGPTIAGLGSLLQIPTGCGEQTMLDLAANVYVTDYLDCVNQLYGDIKTKVIDFTESGYQGVLTYKHSDGSFSAFGNSDKSGSMRLTAFVARVFHQAKRHIFVDDNIINDAIQWMIQQQNTDGSFPEPGVVLSRTMKDQAGSGVRLTLFVLISLLENRDDMKYLNVDEAIQKALAYSEQEVAKLDDLYVLAMASYAFQLAGSNMTQAVLDKLEAESTQKDGMRYWQQPDPLKIITCHSPNPAKAVDIEMTAYVLLAYTKRGDLVAGKSIMQWITKQRNANGGFTSTQDTVVALNALSEYAKQMSRKKFKVHITTQLDDETTYTFDIDKTNSLLLQTRENTKVPAQVVITATGSGMALVQAALSFNVLSDIKPEHFDLILGIVKENFTYLDVETCTRWLGKVPGSAMAVQEFGIPSGFAADLDDLTKLDNLKRVETQNKKVILYFDKIGATPVCLNLRVRRVDFVAKSQPAAVRVYDYYEPRNQVTVFYQSQLLKDSTICDVCPECENCPPLVVEQEEVVSGLWDKCKAIFDRRAEIIFDIIHLL